MTDDRQKGTPQTLREIDISPLRNILEMAGPANQQALIAAFLDDLKSTEFGLDHAWSGPDCAALRLHSHVLIALAGTVGDTDLQAEAQNLNELARDRDLVKIEAMKVRTMRGLKDLIATLVTFIPTEE